METPPTSLIPLLSIAAELRAGGSSWAAVGEEVKRDPETCRHWPRRYPQTWCRLYLQAEGHVIAEAGADARMRLRILVRGNDPKLSLPAAQILLRSSDHHRAVELQADRPTAAQVSVEITEFVKYIKGLNDAQLTAHLDDFLARRAAGAGGDPAGAAPAPGEKRPE
jgi:hypothetical protein